MKRFLILFLCSLTSFAYSVIQEKVLICGICKDVETRLPYTIQIIEDIGNLFADYQVIVYENNSKDKTPKLLQKWSRKNNRVNVTSEKLKRSAFASTIINRKENRDFFHVEQIA